MDRDKYTPQRRERLRLGMLSMYKERLQFCREEFMTANETGNVAYMREMTEEMESLLTASLVLITEGPNVRRYPHLMLLPGP